MALDGSLMALLHEYVRLLLQKARNAKFFENPYEHRKTKTLENSCFRKHNYQENEHYRQKTSRFCKFEAEFKLLCAKSEGGP